MPKLLKDSGQFDYIFFCPGCGNYHGVQVPRWNFNGNIDSPTFSPSIKVTMGPETDPETCLAIPGAKKRICHLFVRDGRIQYLSDCTHHLAGQTVDMIEED